ncbi:MAG: NnrU family protein [Thalassovita sp.]
MEWLEFAVAMVVFMASHRIPALMGIKATLERRLSARGYTAVFSVVSVLLLLWVIWAAGRAPVVPLWPQTDLSRWAVNLALPVAILLGSFGVGARNPFAFEGRSTGFDPARPGIAGVTRQPLLWALLLWSGAHLFANGDLAHVILFGTFAVFSALGMPLVERRRRRQMGPEVWKTQIRQTSGFPLSALFSGKWRPRTLPNLVRLAVALIAWAVLIVLHPSVIGVSPLP